MIPINLGQRGASFGGRRMPQMPNYPAAPQQQAKSPQEYAREAQSYGLAEALDSPIEIQSGSPVEAIAEALAGGLRGRAARTQYQGELSRADWASALEQKQQGAESDEARRMNDARIAALQPEQWSDPYDLGGTQVQRNERTRRVEPVISPMSLPPTWGQPYELNGTQVQQNSRGQISPIGSTAVDPLRRAQAQADVARVTEAQGAADRDATTAMQLNRFAQLNQQEQGTGPMSIGSIAPIFRNAPSQQMAAITADLTPEQREPGSGATSNFDASMFMQALPGLDKAPAANQAIAQAYQVRSQVTAQRAQVMQAWIESGSLAGFDAAWSRYVNANPIFDPNSTPDNPRINPERQDFMTWAQANGVELGTPTSAQLGAGPSAPADTGGGNVIRYDAQGNRIP